MNEACSLIRNAAQNEDVQINFGVVLNEAMGDEVKITVIATGFQRENLLLIERKGAHSSDAPPAVFARLFAGRAGLRGRARPGAGSRRAGSGRAGLRRRSSQVANAVEALFDDLDVPAILRRDRRMLQ